MIDLRREQQLDTHSAECLSICCLVSVALRSAKELRAPQGKENLPASGAATAEGGGVGTPRNHLFADSDLGCNAPTVWPRLRKV